MENREFGAEYLETLEVGIHGGRMYKEKTCFVQDFTEAIICA